MHYSGYLEYSNVPFETNTYQRFPKIMKLGRGQQLASVSFVHWYSSLWEPCLNRCDTDWAGNGSADDEERRVLSVPLQAPVCIWGPGLSSTYSCFFCSFIRGPHPWLPRLGTSWWLYCNEWGKKLLRAGSAIKSSAEPFEISTSRKRPQPIRNNCNLYFIF